MKAKALLQICVILMVAGIALPSKAGSCVPNEGQFRKEKRLRREVNALSFQIQKDQQEIGRRRPQVQAFESSFNLNSRQNEYIKNLNIVLDTVIGRAKAALDNGLGLQVIKNGLQRQLDLLDAEDWQPLILGFKEFIDKNQSLVSEELKLQIESFEYLVRNRRLSRDSIKAALDRLSRLLTANSEEELLNTMGNLNVNRAEGSLLDRQAQDNSAQSLPHIQNMQQELSELERRYEENQKLLERTQTELAQLRERMEQAYKNHDCPLWRPGHSFYMY